MVTKKENNNAGNGWTKGIVISLIPITIAIATIVNKAGAQGEQLKEQQKKDVEMESKIIELKQVKVDKDIFIQYQENQKQQYNDIKELLKEIRKDVKRN